MGLTASQVYSGINSGVAYRKGFRFQNITIPKGAKIISANISYGVSSGGGTGASTVIYGEAADNSATFSKTNNNITLRTKTTNKVSYNNPPKASTRTYTPDLKNIVSEITNRSKWKSGNSMTFLFVESPSSNVLSATNTFEASASTAPLLTVDYVLAAAETNPPLWRNQTTNDADNVINPGDSITLSAEGFDDTGLHIAWLATNESGTWKNYTNNVIIWEDHDFWAGYNPGAPNYNFNFTYKNITNTLLSYGMYQVLGVIPNSTNGELLSTDQQMVDYLNLIKGQPTVEIALHGNTHEDNEFQNLNTAQTLTRLQGGIDVLYNSLKINATTFIPPNGVYNTSTISAFATKKFTRFSTYDYADANPYEYNPSSLLHVPITTEFIDWSVLPDGAMFDAATIEANCQAALDNHGICVFALHHDTFAGVGQTVNQTRYQTLLDVISWVKAKQDIDFKTTAQTTHLDIHDTPMSMGDAAETWIPSNFVWQSNVPAGTNVGWRIYYSDTSGNLNMTDIKTFKVECINQAE
jgi:peptidoglycan/xylan/chitin deacetylase (PgdA/CDA1 family)